MAKLTIVALTAYSSDEVKKESLHVGMKEVLSKPIQAENLKSAMMKYFYDMSSEQIKREKELLKKRQSSQKQSASRQIGEVNN